MSVNDYIFIFDWGGVLGPDNNKYAGNVLGVKYNIDPTELSQEFSSLDRNLKYVTNQKENESYFTYFEDKYKIPAKEVKRTLSNIPTYEGYEYLKLLASDGRHMYVFSNQYYHRARALEKNVDLSIFKRIYFSCDIQLSKPTRESFIHVLNDIKMNAKKCVFVDDRLDNIKTAAELGINTILYKYPEDLRNSLNTYL